MPKPDQGIIHSSRLIQLLDGLLVNRFLSSDSIDRFPFSFLPIHVPSPSKQLLPEEKINNVGNDFFRSFS